MHKKYEQLNGAVQDLLLDLELEPKDIREVAKGDLQLNTISPKTAQKLIDAGALEPKGRSAPSEQCWTDGDGRTVQVQRSVNKVNKMDGIGYLTGALPGGPGFTIRIYTEEVYNAVEKVLKEREEVFKAVEQVLKTDLNHDGDCPRKKYLPGGKYWKIIKEEHSGDSEYVDGTDIHMHAFQMGSDLIVSSKLFETMENLNQEKRSPPQPDNVGDGDDGGPLSAEPIWNKASEPPSNSREVVVWTNYGDVFTMRHFSNGWEEVQRFNKGEVPELWTDKPNGKEEFKQFKEALIKDSLYPVEAIKALQEIRRAIGCPEGVSAIDVINKLLAQVKMRERNIFTDEKKQLPEIISACQALKSEVVELKGQLKSINKAIGCKEGVSTVEAVESIMNRLSIANKRIESMDSTPSAGPELDRSNFSPKSPQGSTNPVYDSTSDIVSQSSSGSYKSGWLIRTEPDRKRWLALFDCGAEMNANIDQALRFSRKIDAERFILHGNYPKSLTDLIAVKYEWTKKSEESVREV
jgi:hypothetical protein